MARVSRFLIAAGAMLLIVAALAALLRSRPGSAARLTVPDRLASLDLAAEQTGPTAAAEIARLHGEAFSLASAVVARYGPNGEATLWVAAAASEGEAADLIDAMRRALARGDSPFTPLEPMQIGGVTLYPLRGMGQEHLYFQSGRLVVWLAADAGVAEASRLAVVEAYR